MHEREAPIPPDIQEQIDAGFAEALKPHPENCDCDHCVDLWWEEMAYLYRKAHGLLPMTPEQAEAAFIAAPEIPMSAEEIERIVNDITEKESP